jgi:hypothetical protein
MKRIFTSILFLLPFLTFAQGPWEFNTLNDKEGWSVSQGSSGAAGTLNATGTAIEYTTITGTSATSRNPTFTNSTANIDATANNQIEISVKNGSAATYLRLSATIGGVVTTYNSVITAGDVAYKIYTFALTTAGTITNLSLEFKLSDGTTSGNNYVPQTAPSTVGSIISIDFIRPKTFVAPIQNTFSFDSTTEGFTTLTRATAVQKLESSRGTLEVKCTTANANNGKVSLSPIVFRVEGTNKYAHITLKNTSTNTLFQLNGKVAGIGTAFNPIQTYTTSDAAYQTYDFDLSTWDSGSQFPELNFGVKDTWLASPQTYAIGATVISANGTYENLTGINTAIAPRADIAATTLANTPPNWKLVGLEGALLDLTNFIYIDNIVFDNVAPVLSIRDIFSPITGKKKKVTTISLYPNPTKETLNIEAKFAVNKIEIYNLAGQNVLQNQNSNKIDVINLDKGVYFVKVTQKYGDPEFLKFIKD